MKPFTVTQWMKLAIICLLAINAWLLLRAPQSVRAAGRNQRQYGIGVLTMDQFNRRSFDAEGDVVAATCRANDCFVIYTTER